VTLQSFFQRHQPAFHQLLAYLRDTRELRPADLLVDDVFCAPLSHGRRIGRRGARLCAQAGAEVAIEKIASDVQPECAEEVGVQSAEVYTRGRDA
jgi:hypothetical protein